MELVDTDCVADNVDAVLKFNFKGTLFQVNCFLFGLTSVSRTLTKGLKAPLASFRQEQGANITVFPDDTLLFKS